MANITVVSYNLRTDLPVRDIALTFRDEVKRPAGALARFAAKSSRLNWEFSTPEEDSGPFAQFEPTDEPTYAVVARFSAHPRAREGTWMELLQQGGGDIFLKIWDYDGYRDIQISHAESLGARSCVRNVLNSLSEADPEIEVTEDKHRMRL
jgi:hypothetical protein